MATRTVLMPIEQDLRTSDSPDVDYVESVIEERSLGEFNHARLQTLLFMLIVNNEPEWDGMSSASWNSASALPATASALRT